MNNENFQGELPYFAVVLSDVIGLTPQKIETNGVIQ